MDFRATVGLGTPFPAQKKPIPGPRGLMRQREEKPASSWLPVPLHCTPSGTPHLASRLLLPATPFPCIPRHPGSESIVYFNSQVSFSPGTRLFS